MSHAPTCFLDDLAEAGDPPAPRSVPLPADLAARLDKVSRGQDAARRLLLTAATAALLHRHTGADEVTVGHDGQPLTVPVGPGTPFRALLLALRDQLRAGGAASTVDVAVGPAGTPARVLVSAEGDVLTVRCDGRFTAATAERLLRHLVLLLDQVTAEPDRALGDVDLWSAADGRVVAAANATVVPFDTADTLVRRFARQVAATPDAPALIDADGAALTYAELAGRAERVAQGVRAHGIGADDVVGVLAGRSVETVVAIFGVLAAGAAYLPLDPAYPQARRDALVADARARLVLDPAVPVPAPPATAGPADGGPADGALADGGPGAGPADGGPAGVADGGPGAGDLAYVIYTSGSTGTPKGVEVEHRAVVNRLGWMQRAYPIGPGDVILHKTSTSFDVSVWELFWWAGTGAALALLEPGGEKDPAAIVAAVQRHGVTTMHVVPSMLTMLLAHLERSGDAARLAGLRRVFASGEALGRGHVRRLTTLLPGTELVNLYGPTETTVDVTVQPCPAPTPPARVPIGRPIDNLRLHVLDAAGRPAPVGVPGELVIAGVGLARGYRHRPELTAERFGPAAGEDRAYRTGDLARWLPDGTLDYLGRLDQQVKVRGFRVEPGEIEERLRSHPAVRDAAVVAVDDGWQTTLRGFVVLDGAAGAPELKAYLRGTLPEHLVPAQLVPLAELPVTASGKLDRAALTRPGGVRPVPAYVPPRTEAERTLAGIWQDVLGVPRVGVRDNFFALGGNSIHFVAVLARARAAGLDFTFQQLFGHQSVAALAEVLGTEGTATKGYPAFSLLSEEDRALLPADAVDAYPLSMLQAGLVFQTEITGGLGQYHDVIGYQVDARYDAAAFERAVRELVRRHPMLRTTYHLTGFSEFVQVVHADVPPPLTVVDLRGLDPAAQQAYDEQWVLGEKARPFDWERGGLVGLHVQVLSDERFRYTISQHNSALDGWSISLLHTQLFQLYLDRAPEAPVDDHLRTFVGLERDAVASPASRDFWREVCAGAAGTEVPPKPGARATDDFAVVLRDVPLPAGTTERVTALADRLSVPVKDVLLAAHVRVLGELSGDAEVCTGYEHSGRPELPGAEAALGLFLNTVPFRVPLGGGSWADLVGRVYRAELDLLPHRRYPMAQMKQDLGTRRELFTTTFNYTHFYLLKELRALPGFDLVEMRVDSETEFVLRTEFDRDVLDGELRLALHFHTHLFSTEQVDAVGRCFVRALELMTARPDAPHEAVPLLDAPELFAAATPAPGGPAPAPGGTAAGPGGDGTAAVRAAIAAVWARVLDLPAASIGPDDGFFDLGGNSLSALRVVLELDGLVTLADLTRHPRLGELAERAGRAADGPDQLVQLLSSSALGTRCALVCVPYPGGHPINFRPLADAVEERTADLAVYAVEQPGHDPDRPGEFADVAGTARRVVAELSELDTPVLLWGHCGGASVAVEVARQLEERARSEQRGAPLLGVLIGSKLLPTRSDMRESIEMIESWTDDDVLRYLVEETGYAELAGMDLRRTGHVGQVFRHDVLGGYHYFRAATESPQWRIEAPFWSVVAADDPALADQAGEHDRWRLLAADLRTHVLGSGGHYFVRANPEETAELVQAAWQAATETAEV